MEILNKEKKEKSTKLIKFQLLRFARRRRILCKNGMYLAIDKNGVHGTKDPKNPYADLQVLSIGSDMLAFWGTKACLYLAVNAQTGQIYTTPDEGQHCVFLESITPDFYNFYESYRSVYDGQPQCLILNAQNKLIIADTGTVLEKNGQFIWELFDDAYEKYK
ncbi:fibroblast growth factor 6 [Hydra vulgaris]|uniref:fibroblast growth factor 6 n=1 Tax=Hydra vulgaris TaxID=6087 RepID=UPI001F5F3B9C|nr:fibroblast growth factor 6-like [Hydra vulgaris]